MVKRTFWLKAIDSLWKKRSLIWLSGVRRSGKTFLCQSVPRVEYFDCELPRIRRLMEDPQSFWESLRGKRVVLDEIHRLGNPSELLKIAADYHPDVLVIATGSSTLGASRKFRDTLSGRKSELWLTPMIEADLEDFKNTDLKHRLFRGGLPPFFMAKDIPERDFQEWLDAYWAKDLEELFRLEKRYSFGKFVELLMAQSGGIFEASRFAQPCEVSRGTIANYLKALEATYVVHVIRPFSSHRPTEIVAAPKIYGFDTGFVVYHKGWGELRREDLGLLWEHFVLNELHAASQSRAICYWRDKAGHELDFVLNSRGKPLTVIECKWRAQDFNPANLLTFRRKYEKGKNYVVAHDIDKSYRRRYDNIEVQFLNLTELIRETI